MQAIKNMLISFGNISLFIFWLFGGLLCCSFNITIGVAWFVLVTPLLISVSYELDRLLKTPTSVADLVVLEDNIIETWRHLPSEQHSILSIEAKMKINTDLDTLRSLKTDNSSVTVGYILGERRVLLHNLIDMRKVNKVSQNMNNELLELEKQWEALETCLRAANVKKYPKETIIMDKLWKQYANVSHLPSPRIFF